MRFTQGGVMKITDRLFELSQTDAILVVSDKNRMYFTGFASTFGFLILMPQNKNIFITDPRYYEMAQVLQADNVDVRLIENGASAYGMVKDVFAENNVKTVGFEDTELTVSDFSSMKDAFVDFELVPVGKHINFVRSFKDETELEYIRKAQSITDLAFSEILKFIKPGITEREVAIELEYIMQKNGSEGLAFDTIIASGVNSSKPHAHPSDKRIELGDPVTMDFGARYHGYCSDMTRTIFVGNPSDEMRKIYNIVLLAQTTAINNAYCGVGGKELDSFAREIIRANGYDQYFTHSTGHSLGIDIHEAPNASTRSEAILHAKQLITVEPGIYVPGLGGVRIEDLLLIEQDSVIDLTTSDKNIIIL